MVYAQQLYVWLHGYTLINDANHSEKPEIELLLISTVPCIQ